MTTIVPTLPMGCWVDEPHTQSDPQVSQGRVCKVPASSRRCLVIYTWRKVEIIELSNNRGVIK